MFSDTEIILGALLGIWSPKAPGPGIDRPIEFKQDLEFVCRVINQVGAGGRPSYATVVLPRTLTNTKTLFHLIALLVVKKFMQVKFPTISPVGAEANRDREIGALHSFWLSADTLPLEGIPLYTISWKRCLSLYTRLTFLTSTDASFPPSKTGLWAPELQAQLQSRWSVSPLICSCCARTSSTTCWA